MISKRFLRWLRAISDFRIGCFSGPTGTVSEKPDFGENYLSGMVVC